MDENSRVQHVDRKLFAFQFCSPELMENVRSKFKFELNETETVLELFAYMKITDINIDCQEYYKCLNNIIGKLNFVIIRNEKPHSKWILGISKVMI